MDSMAWVPWNSMHSIKFHGIHGADRVRMEITIERNRMMGADEVDANDSGTSFGELWVKDSD